MKRYWYVLLEQYESGAVKAAVIQSMVAPQRPKELYRKEIGREIYGEWFESEAEALQIVAEARAINATLVSASRRAA